MSQFNENAKWRYATKKFDTTKKVSDNDLATLKEAIQLSASSFGLQLYKVIIVENPEIRAQLQPASWGQTQIVDASHLLVFANQTKFDDSLKELFDEISIGYRFNKEKVKNVVDSLENQVNGWLIIRAKRMLKCVYNSYNGDML
jgi:nitroreductase